MGMRWFTQLTNGLSKRLENLEHAVSLHFLHYNFARVHKRLRVTPAKGFRRSRGARPQSFANGRLKKSLEAERRLGRVGQALDNILENFFVHQRLRDELASSHFRL